MKRLFFAAAVCLLALAGCKQSIPASMPAQIKDGAIELSTPAREPGQVSALGLKCDPIDTVRIAFVGVGGRGSEAVKRYTYLDGVKVVAVCDLYKEKTERANSILTGKGCPAAEEYVGPEAYKEICERDDIDLVYIATDWMSHVPIAVYAMEHGKHAAVEVPAACTVEECWQLVNTCEKTRRHCMMLENCCYDFFEATTLNMAQQGLFGEVYHVEGAYIHNLADYWNPNGSEYWRIGYNKEFRGDNYPTHGLGPVCQVLNIHRGDRMTRLIAMDTKSYKGLESAIREMGDSTHYAEGDHTITLINTAKEKLIEIQHNVYACRPYSRMHQLTGTDGFANKYPVQTLSVRGINGHRSVDQAAFDSLMNAYKPKFIEEIEDKALEVGGHGGMDFIMDYRLVYCLRNGLPLDQDVYDAAEWSCTAELSRLSLEHGCMPVIVPDFTRGDWDKTDGFHYAFAE